MKKDINPLEQHAKVEHDAVFDGAEVPTMSSASDADLARRMCEGLEADATIVELGPWLGALSHVLAAHGNLHVVDSFVWTEDHDKRVPGLLRPDESFRPAFQKIMQRSALDVVVHESEFASFRWDGGRIDLCFIDAPKKPAALREAIEAVLPGLNGASRLLVKNANTARNFPMMVYIQALCDQGALSLLEAEVDGACNTAAFEVRVQPGELAALIEQTPLDSPVRSCLAEGALGRLGTFQLGLVCELIAQGAWADAYEVIGQMEGSRRILKAWYRSELRLADEGVDSERLGWLGEIMALQHSKSGLPKPPSSFKASAAMSRRAFWINNRDKPWRARAFHPEVLERAHHYGYMKWPNAIQKHVRGKDVLDVGCGPGLHGFGYLAAGASSYLGLDPIIELDRDRVKNMEAKSAKMPFGWTPAELSRMFEPWTVLPTLVEELPTGEKFDIAVMHNVTEHLHEIESVFAAVAERLRPGGKLLYNHHNYYCWNGHHLPPKRVADIDLSDPSQAELVDWGHVEYEPEPDHYIARGLNRMRLDEIIGITEHFFDIEFVEEKPSQPETGFDRLTDDIRRRYPYLTDRDFRVQHLFCIATVRA